MAKNTYIDPELAIAERFLAQWEQYMEANPIDKIEDRWGKKEMPRGGHTWVVTASREAQIKCVQDTLEKYLRMLDTIKRLRKIEAEKVDKRGGGDVPFLMTIQNDEDK